MTTILPDKWSTLLNVLKPLNTQGSINIVNSGIYQDVNSGVATLVANIGSLVGEGITFDIMSPAKHIKLFKLLETDKDVDLLDDSDNEQFIVSNGQIKIYLPKQIESISEAAKPDYEGLVQIGEPIKVDKKTKREVETFIKSENVDSIDLLLKDDQLVGFEVKNTGVYLFSDYTNIAAGITSETADMVFKSLAFLIIDGDDFTVNVGKYPDDRHLLITDITTGYMTMSLNEELDLGGSGDELDLI